MVFKPGGAASRAAGNDLFSDGRGEELHGRGHAFAAAETAFDDFLRGVERGITETAIDDVCPELRADGDVPAGHQGAHFFGGHDRRGGKQRGADVVDPAAKVFEPF